jgi:hypothetical protein
MALGPIGEGWGMIIIAFILGLLAIFADGGFTDEAFQNPPCIMDEME